MLDALKTYRDEGVWLEITNLVVPGWTDKEDEIRLMCRWLADNGFTDDTNTFQPFSAAVQARAPASHPCRHT
ncbi:MAG: hypothetical protein MZV63_23070 [Marinilabiliales bacterium]|nr:hypothetical protein [Marinilabiliales bacterium]